MRQVQAASEAQLLRKAGRPQKMARIQILQLS